MSYRSVIVFGCSTCPLARASRTECYLEGEAIPVVHQSASALPPVQPRIRREANALGIRPGEGAPEWCPLRKEPTVITFKENP